MSITVPTTPYTNQSGTKLLTCQSNRFVDNSSGALTITRNGDVLVTPFSPFAPTAAYSAGTNGGSGYFDGSGDYLSASVNDAFKPGTGDFTIEAWVYPTGSVSGGGPGIFDCRVSGNESGGFILNLDASYQPVFYSNTTLLTGSIALNLFSWNHVALTRSSTTATLWVNGASAGTVSNSTNFTTGGCFVGAAYTGANNLFVGNIANLRLLKGTAQYTTAFTPPTAPLTAITNTSLLLNFTNAGIIDNTGKNNLETVGDAQIDTTTKKYGTGSLEFDGTGDRLQSVAGNPDFNFGTGNFTIEFWLYANATTGGVLSLGITGNVVNAADLGFDVIFISNNLRFRIMVSTTAVTVASPSVSASTWTHFALVRNGSTFTVYKDGTSQGTASNSGSLNFNSAWPVKVGSDAGDTPTYFNGFIDDLRITKGIARYTANFVPPIARFPNQ